MKSQRIFLSGVIACAWLLMGFTWGDPLARQTQKGLALFDAGKYAEALQAFTEADVHSTPGDPRLPDVYANMGNTLMKQGKPDEAAAMYQKAFEATTDPKLKADEQYNLGNAWLTKQQYQQALDAYKQALELQPQHEQAQQNKALVEKLFAAQQQQQQQDKEKKDEQKDQEKQDQQQQKSGENGNDQQQGKEPEQPQEQASEQEKPEQQPTPAQPSAQQTPSTEEQQAAAAEQTPADKEQQLSKEEALRILDALQEKEQLQQQQRQVAPRPVEKDW